MPPSTGCLACTPNTHAHPSKQAAMGVRSRMEAASTTVCPQPFSPLDCVRGAASTLPSLCCRHHPLRAPLTDAPCLPSEHRKVAPQRWASSVASAPATLARARASRAARSIRLMLDCGISTVHSRSCVCCGPGVTVRECGPRRFGRKTVVTR